MQYFLDSAKLDEIDYAYHTFGIDGITTNPRHIMDSGKTFQAAVTDIAQWIRKEGLEGAERFPVSVEIDPYIEDAREMVAAAEKIAAICGNFVIKIPCTPDGIAAARTLEKAAHEDCRQYIRDIVQIYKNYGFYGKTRIICAAVRTGRQIVDCAVAGADIVTAGLAVYRDTMVHPYTQQGMDIFRNAWDNTAK